jgi:hypothetical protein
MPVVHDSRLWRREIDIATNIFGFAGILAGPESQMK